MKKLIGIFLALLLLAGCASDPHTNESLPVSTGAEETGALPGTTAAPEPEAPAPGLYELRSYTAADGYRPVTMAARGSEAVVLLFRTPADPEHPTAYVQILDLDAGSTGPILPLEGSENFDGSMLSIEADGSLLYYNPYEDSAAHFDRAGRLLGQIENPYPARDNPRFPHELGNQWFTYQDSVASYHSYAEARYLFTAYAFADEPEALYLVDGGFDSLRCTAGKRVLESDWLPNNSGLSYRILDLEAGRELDRVTIGNDAPEEAGGTAFLNEGEALFCDAGVVLRVNRDYYAPDAEYGEGGAEPEWEDRIYLWRVDETAAQSLAVRHVTEDGLRAENDEIVARIAEQYEIKVLLDIAPEGDIPPMMPEDNPEDYADATLITGVEPFPAYELLKQLERFLALLPEGFPHEMQTDFPAPRTVYSPTGFEGFDIYVIKEIPGSSNAYAFRWGERLKIVLATDEFNASTLPHEFMHLIESRLEAFYDSVGESFREGWIARNPEGFDYYNETDRQGLVYDYFVSQYAMTDSDEDIAETFMYMFTAQEPLAESSWYSNAPHIQAKVAYLTEAIRRSFPSVQAVGRVYWESK